VLSTANHGGSTVTVIAEILKHSIHVSREDGGRIELLHEDGSVTYCSSIVVRPVIPEYISNERMDRERKGYRLKIKGEEAKT
jgi:hypothetical protein